MGQLVYGTLYFVLTVSLFVAVRHIIYQKKVIDSLENEVEQSNSNQMISADDREAIELIKAIWCVGASAKSGGIALAKINAAMSKADKSRDSKRGDK